MSDVNKVHSIFLHEEEDISGDDVKEEDNNIQISQENTDKEKYENELEFLRRQINILKDIVNSNADIKSQYLCIDAVFKQEVNFEIAFQYCLLQMQYQQLEGSVLSINTAKLDLLKSNLDKIKRINTTLSLSRSLGCIYMEQEVKQALIAKEFGIQANNTSQNSEFLRKLNEVLESYAEKVRTAKV